MGNPRLSCTRTRIGNELNCRRFFARFWPRCLASARARRPRSALRGLLLAFQPLELAWAGKGEVLTLMKAEWQGGQALLTGKALFFGYYLNELLLSLLPREDAHEALFLTYAKTLQGFTVALQETDLRCFERAFLQKNSAYGLTLERDARGALIDPKAHYAYVIEQGPVRLSQAGHSSLAI